MKQIILALLIWLLVAVAGAIVAAQLVYWFGAPGWAVNAAAFVGGVVVFTVGMAMVAGGESE